MSDKKNYYYNRELSWMDFNARVLEEAQKKDNPLMERLRFLAITGSNLDEFFMVRVAGVKSQIASNYTKPDDSGMTPKELLSALDKKCTPLWKSSIPAYTALFCRSSKSRRKSSSARRKSSRTSKEPLRTSIFIACCSPC